MAILQLADNFATPPPTERVLLQATKKTRDNLSIISRELREEDSNLRPPGYEPGKLTNCSTPRCIFTLKWSFVVFASAKVRQKIETSKSISKIFSKIVQKATLIMNKIAKFEMSEPRLRHFYATICLFLYLFI